MFHVWQKQCSITAISCQKRLTKPYKTTLERSKAKLKCCSIYNKFGVLTASRKMKVSSLILKLFWTTTQYSCINRHLGKCQISRNIAPLNSSLHKPATNHHPGPVSPYPLGPRWFYWHAQCSWLIPTPSTRTQAGHYSLHARATAGPSTLPASTDFRPDRGQVWNWHSDFVFFEDSSNS